MDYYERVERVTEAATLLFGEGVARIIAHMDATYIDRLGSSPDTEEAGKELMFDPERPFWYDTWTMARRGLPPVQ